MSTKVTGVDKETNQLKSENDSITKSTPDQQDFSEGKGLGGMNQITDRTIQMGNMIPQNVGSDARTGLSGLGGSSGLLPK
jgi:hypothetical protein